MDARVQQVLRFDRFYAQRLHANDKAAKVQEGTATELRAFHELGQEGGRCTPGWQSWRLDLNHGYVSRILKLFELQGYLTTHVSDDDQRRREIELTPWGREVFRGLEQFHESLARNTLEALPQRQQWRLVKAMAVIEAVLTRDALANLMESSRERERRRRG